MKRLLLAGLVLFGALGAIQVSVSTANANHVDCSAVRCAECPAGTVFSPTPHDCCRCVPVK